MLINVYHWYGDLEVLIKVEDKDSEIYIVGFRNVLRKDVVDVIVGINGAFGRGRWFQEPVSVPL